MAGSITLNWTDEQEDDLLAILEVKPIPKDAEGNDLHTLKQWLKIIIKQHLKSLSQQADRNKKEQAARNNVHDREVMQ